MNADENEQGINRKHWVAPEQLKSILNEIVQPSSMKSIFILMLSAFICVHRRLKYAVD